MPALPKAVLFDLDDTLIRAYAQPAEAWTRLLQVFAVDRYFANAVNVRRIKRGIENLAIEGQSVA